MEGMSCSSGNIKNWVFDQMITQYSRVDLLHCCLHLSVGNEADIMPGRNHLYTNPRSERANARRLGTCALFIPVREFIFRIVVLHFFRNHDVGVFFLLLVY